MQAEMNESLAQERSSCRRSRSGSRRWTPSSSASATRSRRQQLASHEESIKARIAVQQSQVDQARAVMRLKQRQRDDLNVRAGLDGILQLVPVEVGQQVAPGTNLARVANPGRLKAEIKIAETQAKDIQIGQKAARRHAQRRRRRASSSRIDPSVQNGTRHRGRRARRRAAQGRRSRSHRRRHDRARANGGRALRRPPGVRPGTKHRSDCSRCSRDGSASRVQVKIGRISVNAVEILDGLNVGDQVVLSDMSHVGRVRSRPPSMR